ncbi:hypothetical protein FGO68_gene17401 [Halteria grandinella]|uniref:EF-hand domain-containing protein n=1 Tax=Halteria grandinella TaxID=5974 RepID=A0A8J8P704_HALGN|nr:hypothetical protein FGO68_gene17401 [Halteria grandinella]
MDYELFSATLSKISSYISPTDEKVVYPLFTKLYQLANGGSIPSKSRPYEPELIKKNKKFYINQYLDIFGVVFKDDWRKIAALHKSLIINHKLGSYLLNSDSTQQSKYHQFIIEEQFKEHLGFNIKQLQIMGSINMIMEKEFYSLDKLYKFLKVSKDQQKKMETILTREFWQFQAQCKNQFAYDDTINDFFYQLRYEGTEDVYFAIALLIGRIFEQFAHTEVVPYKGQMQFAAEKDFKKETEKKVIANEMIKLKLYTEHVELYLKNLVGCMRGSTSIALDTFVNYFSAIQSSRVGQKMPQNPFLATGYSFFPMHKQLTKEKEELVLNDKAIMDQACNNGIPNLYRMLMVITAEGIQGSYLKSSEMIGYLYQEFANKTDKNWQANLIERISILRQTILSSDPLIEKKTNDILMQLNNNEPLTNEQIYLCKTLLAAVNDCDVNQAAKLADILTIRKEQKTEGKDQVTNNSSFKYLRTMIASFTDINRKQTEVTKLLKKRELCRIFEYSIRKQFQGNKTADEIDEALKQIIIQKQIPPLFGLCITDQLDIQMDYLIHYLQMFSEFAITNELGLSVEAFDLMETVSSARSENYNQLLKHLQFTSCNELQDGKILHVIVQKAKKFSFMDDLIQQYFTWQTQPALKRFKAFFEKQQVPIDGSELEKVTLKILSMMQEVIQESNAKKDDVQNIAADFNVKFQKELPKLATEISILNNSALSSELYKECKDYLETALSGLDLHYHNGFIIKVFNCFSGKGSISLPIVEIIDNIVIPLVDFNKDLQDAITLMKFLGSNEPLLALDYLPGFMRLIFTQLRAVSALDMDDDAIAKTIVFIQGWMKVVTIAISMGNQRQSVQDKDKAIIQSLTQAFDQTIVFVEALKLGDEVGNQLKKVKVIRTALTSIIHLCQGNFEGLESLASLLGAVPEKEGFQRLKAAISVVQNNKEGISFSAAKQIASANVDLVFKAMPIKIPGMEKIEILIQKGMENPSSLIDPKTFFDIFKNEKGIIGMEEFKNIFVQLGINIPHAMVLQIFSVADIEKKGELSYHEFTKAMVEIKHQLIQKLLVDLGFSMREIIMSLAFTIFMLILQFIFIFIGMAAFSPTTTFSSVINSLLAVGSSLGAKGKDKEDKGADEIKDIGGQSGELSAV